MGRSASSLAVVLLACSFAGSQVATRQCGYDRWPVKIFHDKDRDQVNPHPLDSTVAALGAIPIHEIPYPYDRRIKPEELQVYRVKARLLKIRHESDSDLHLLLADLNDPEKRMIAEIPAPECADGTGHEEQFRLARTTITSIPVNSVVEVVGVGFFDFLHEQRGAAKNGIELHPVLSIKRAN